MSSVVPNTTSTPIYHLPPKQPNPRKAVTTTQRAFKFLTPLHCSSSSSSFKTRATVEAGGFIGEKRLSFYQLLGISEEGSFDEIKKAYKQLARKYHPDVSPPERTEEYTRRFIEVLEAYETLSDPGRRAVYDRDFARGLHLAFSTTRRFDQELEERSQWKNRWEDQVAELKRRSMNKDSEENLSWGARMRRHRTKSSTE